MGFTWECDGNTLEEKGMIEDSLPEGFTYKIAKYKLIERSEIKEEIKFRAVFSVSVSDKEEATIFIEKIATLNGTELRKRTKEMRRKDFASQRYNCSRKLRKRKKNHEKQVGKDTDCQAFFSFKLYDSKNDAGEYDLLKIIFVCLPFQKYFHFLFITLFLGIIAKDCFFTLVKSRLLLGSPSWSVGCFHAENDLIHRKMVVNCPIMITSKVKPFSRQNYTGKGE